MKTLIAALLIPLAAAAVVGIIAIFSALVGAFAGWSVGLLFPETMNAFAQTVGLEAPYQLGAAFAFIGSFFRTAATTK